MKNDSKFTPLMPSDFLKNDSPKLLGKVLNTVVAVSSVLLVLVIVLGAATALGQPDDDQVAEEREAALAWCLGCSCISIILFVVGIVLRYHQDKYLNG